MRPRRGQLPILLAAVALFPCSGCGQRGGKASAAAEQAAQARARTSRRPAPNFTLTDQFGHRTSLSQYRGKAVLLAFVDAKCTTLCPLTTTSMLDAVHELGSTGRRVKLLGIDANPDAAAVRDVRSYSRAHGMLYRWSFLTGTRSQLVRAWKAYDVAVQKVHGEIGHEAITYVIDPSGQERAAFGTAMAYSSVEEQANQLARSLGSVLGVHPVASHGLRPPSDVIPKQKATFTVAVGPKPGTRVALGPAHPHLFVFIASWLRQSLNLRSRLLALDRYARLARRRGWPTPVGVDLASVEQSPGTLKRVLAHEHISLDFPLIDDRSGALADGYRVRDAPWLELISPQGRIAWTHDGWISDASLATVARHAETRWGNR